MYKGQEGGLARLALSQVSAANHPALDRAYDALRTAWVEARARARARAARPDLPGTAAQRAVATLTAPHRLARAPQARPRSPGAGGHIGAHEVPP